MRCYKHPERDAVGMCKVCDKGLCEDCAVEVDDFLFCAKHAKMERAVKHAEREALGELEEEPKEAQEEPEEAAAPAPMAARQQAKPLRKPLKAIPKKLLDISAKSMLTPAVVGGIITGTPSGIPFLNFACIIWMLLGGAAASYLLLLKESSKCATAPSKLKYPDAAFVGAISGIIGGSVAFVFSLFSGVTFWQQMLDLLLANGLDYNAAVALLSIVVVDPQIDLVLLLAKWLVFAVVFPLFGAIGAVLAAKISEMT